MTFTLLAAGFAAAALLIGWVVDGPRPAWTRWRVLLLTVAGMSLLTAVFDNVMIAADLFDYGDHHLLGPRVGRAPIEDFTYPLVAALLLPSLWHRLRRRQGAPAAPASASRPAGPDGRTSRDVEVER